MRDRISKLEESRNVLLSVIATQHEAIKLLEWRGGNPNSDGKYHVCPICGADKQWGHYVGCAMATMLNTYEKAHKKEVQP